MHSFCDGPSIRVQADNVMRYRGIFSKLFSWENIRIKRDRAKQRLDAYSEHSIVWNLGANTCCAKYLVKQSVIRHDRYGKNYV